MIAPVDIAKRTLPLIFLAIVLVIVGCGEDTENGVENDSEQSCHPPMYVISTSILRGGEVPSNTSIAVHFTTAAFDFLEISVSEATGITRIDGDIAIWTPTEDMPLGPHTLTIDAGRVNCRLEEFTPLKFTVVGPDKTPPVIVDAKCDPENSAMGVNPDDYTEELTIAFSEPMLEVDVISASLDVYLPSGTRSHGYNLITIDLQGNRLPYDTEFKATLSGTDYSGNELATTEYSFVTMKKPQ